MGQIGNVVLRHSYCFPAIGHGIREANVPSVATISTYASGNRWSPVHNRRTYFQHTLRSSLTFQIRRRIIRIAYHYLSPTTRVRATHTRKDRATSYVDFDYPGTSIPGTHRSRYGTDQTWIARSVNAIHPISWYNFGPSVHARRGDAACACSKYGPNDVRGGRFVVPAFARQKGAYG